MTVPAAHPDATSATNVRMGELFVDRQNATFKTLLGSCIGVAIYDHTSQIGGLAHVLLPSSRGHRGPSGKFVDTAVSELIGQIERLGGRRHRLRAKIAGGARMFSTTTTSTIGDQNLNAVLCELKERAIPVAGSHCGGTQGRRMTFCVMNGKTSIEIVGAESVEI